MRRGIAGIHAFWVVGFCLVMVALAVTGGGAYALLGKPAPAAKAARTAPPAPKATAASKSAANLAPVPPEVSAKISAQIRQLWQGKAEELGLAPTMEWAGKDSAARKGGAKTVRNKAESRKSDAPLTSQVVSGLGPNSLSMWSRSAGVAPETAAWVQSAFQNLAEGTGNVAGSDRLADKERNAAKAGPAGVVEKSCGLPTSMSDDFKTLWDAVYGADLNVEQLNTVDVNGVVLSEGGAQLLQPNGIPDRAELLLLEKALDGGSNEELAARWNEIDNQLSLESGYSYVTPAIMRVVTGYCMLGDPASVLTGLIGGDMFGLGFALPNPSATAVLIKPSPWPFSCWGDPDGNTDVDNDGEIDGDGYSNLMEWDANVSVEAYIPSTGTPPALDPLNKPTYTTVVVRVTQNGPISYPWYPNKQLYKYDSPPTVSLWSIPRFAWKPDSWLVNGLPAATVPGVQVEVDNEDDNEDRPVALHVDPCADNTQPDAAMGGTRRRMNVQVTYVPDPNAPLYFSDFALLEAVREAVGRPDQNVIYGDWLNSGRTSLDASGRGITDLTGVEQLVGLTCLNLSNNDIADFGPLSELTSLTEVNLAGNQITDISALVSVLQGLSALTTLDLSDNEIVDLTPLSALTAIEELKLGGNQTQGCILDLSPLAYMNKLETLSIENVPLDESALTVLESLAALKNVTFRNCGLTQVPPFRELASSQYPRRIEYLDLSHNSVHNLAPLHLMTSLEYLDISFNQTRFENDESWMDLLYLVENSGLRDGSIVDIRGNPYLYNGNPDGLACDPAETWRRAPQKQVEALELRGVKLKHWVPKLPPTVNRNRVHPFLAGGATMAPAGAFPLHEDMLAQYDMLTANIYAFSDSGRNGPYNSSTIRAKNPKIQIICYSAMDSPPWADIWGAVDMGPQSPWTFVPDPIVTNPGRIIHLENVCGHELTIDFGGGPLYCVNPYKSNYLLATLYADAMNRDVWSQYSGEQPIFDGLHTDSGAVGTGPNDTDEDRVLTKLDVERFVAGFMMAAGAVRQARPDAILHANGFTPPWPAHWPYYEYYNGCTEECAMHSGFPEPEKLDTCRSEWKKEEWERAEEDRWQVMWRGYQVSLTAGNPKWWTSTTENFPRMHIINVTTDYYIGNGIREYADDARHTYQLSEEDFRRMRLGLCTVLLCDGGYLWFDSRAGGSILPWWFEEYDADLGDSGNPFVPHARPQGKDYYTRQFDNGMVVVNPTSKPVDVIPDNGKTYKEGVTDLSGLTIYRDATPSVGVDVSPDNYGKYRIGQWLKVPAYDARIFVKSRMPGKEYDPDETPEVADSEIATPPHDATRIFSCTHSPETWQDSGTTPVFGPSDWTIYIAPGTANGETFKRLSVRVDLKYAIDNYMTVTLITPDNRSIDLIKNVGALGEDFCGTILDDGASTPIWGWDAKPPYSGMFKPCTNLSQLEGGTIEGAWTLRVGATSGTIGDTRCPIGGHVCAGTLYGFHLGFDLAQPEEDMEDIAPYQCDSSTLEKSLTVGVSPAYTGFTYPETGTHEYSQGSVIELVATPKQGYVFDHWEVDGSSMPSLHPGFYEPNGSMPLTLDADKTANAVFAEAHTLTLSVSHPWNGSVYPGVGTFAYKPTETAAIVSVVETTPDLMIRFRRWEGEGVNPSEKYDKTAHVDLSSPLPRVVTAEFAAVYNLYINAAEDPGSGTVKLNGQTAVAGQGYTFWEDDAINLEAEPAPGYRFDHWVGLVDYPAPNPTTPEYVFTMDHPYAVTPFFTRQYTLTTAVSASGGGIVSPEAGVPTLHDSGSLVTITAEPDCGYAFEKWLVDGVQHGDSSPMTNILMDADKAVEAVFSPSPINLTVNSDPPGTGTVALSPEGSPFGVYATCSTVTISATPEDGWEFDRFSAVPESGEPIDNIDDIDGIDVTIENGTGKVTAPITMNVAVTAHFKVEIP